MASFLTWANWLELKEDNARKRAVRAALAGTGPKLPGSYAACPSTNVLAMDSAAKTGEVSAIKKKRRFKESGEAKPDYSFDRWVQMAQDFGSEVNGLMGQAKEDEKELDKKDAEDKKKIDKEKTQKPKKEPKEKTKEQPPVDLDDDKQKLLKKLQAIAKQPKSERKPEED